MAVVDIIASALGRVEPVFYWLALLGLGIDGSSLIPSVVVWNGRHDIRILHATARTVTETNRHADAVAAELRASGVVTAIELRQPGTAHPGLCTCARCRGRMRKELP